MKKILLLLVVIISWHIAARAQSISLLNLTNLTSLNNKQAADDFAARKAFRLQWGEEVGGFLIETYQTQAPRNKVETVTVGRGFKLASGGVLYTVSYVSADPQHVLNLMEQSKSINVKQTFQGSDTTDNIYIFDSFLYRMTVRMSFDRSRSSIDISQKQVFIE